jgi:two-component system, response regulator
MKISLQILLIDDSEDDFRLMQRAFAKLNLDNLLWLKSGDEAMQRLADESFVEKIALIICDLKMPHVDGFDVLRFAKSTAVLRRVPFVILTSSNQPKDREKARGLEADLYLVKPTRFGELVDVATRLIDWARSAAAKSPRVQMELFNDRLENLRLNSGDQLAEYDICVRWTLESLDKVETSAASMGLAIGTLKEEARVSERSQHCVNLRLLAQCEWMCRHLQQQWRIAKQNVDVTLRQISSVSGSEGITRSLQGFFSKTIRTGLGRNQRRAHWLLGRLEFLDAKIDRIRARMNPAQ